MNLTVPVVTGRLRRKSIAAEVVHCLTDLRLEHDDAVGPTSGSAKHTNKRRGSLGGEPVRRPSLVSRWFKHISDAADAYKARTKGSHEYAEDPAAGSGGHPPKDTFETVTESQKIEQISTTPLDSRLERKDSSQQCRAISTGGGPGGPPSIGHSTSNVSTGSAGSGGGYNNNNEDSLPNKNRTANESDDNAENEEKEKFKRRSQYGDDEDQKLPATDDVDVDDQRTTTGHHYRGRGQGCALTQQCSLVAPSEIHVSVSNALTAEPILTPSEKLRRLDQAIRKTLIEKQRVVCDMFRVPDEHFLAIADIAGQPEAPQKEPTDIILAAFAQVRCGKQRLGNLPLVEEAAAR